MATKKSKTKCTSCKSSTCCCEKLPPLARPQLILALVASDRTFKPAVLRAHQPAHVVWVGKCIHCRASLVVDPVRPANSQATVEHIVPQSLQGGNTKENLALACARCNHQKGSRLDPLGLQNPRLMQVITVLQQERRRRYREPPSELLLSPASVAWLAKS